MADILLSDLIDELPAGVPVVLVPDDSLGVLPFEMLPLTDTGGIIIDRKKMVPCVTGAQFFVYRNPVTYSQSVTALGLAGTFSGSKPSGDRCLVMADPILGPDDPRLDDLQREELVNSMGTALDTLMSARQELNITWPRLQLTAELGDFLRKLDPDRTDIFLGREANKEKLFSCSLMDYRALVFATHGYAGLDLPGIQEPVLVLTLWNQPDGKDGFLRLSEVMNLKLNAEVATLTACESGLGKRISGEGIMGRGRAFQHAGAKSVLMSLWSVEQSASINLVENFFKYIQEGRSKLEALSLSRRDVRMQGYDHPFFWAPFILVGEAR